MGTKIEKYKALEAAYKQRRAFFKQKLDTFTSRFSRKTQEYGFQLIAQADQLSQELDALLQKHTPGQPLPNDFPKKFRQFKRAYKQLHEITKPVWRQMVETIVFALVLVLILRNLLFGLFHVPTGSAEPNILVGDRVWGNALCYFYEPVKHGDLVIFDGPEIISDSLDAAQDGSNTIKRFSYDRSNIIKYWWQRYVGFPIPMLGLPAGPANWVKRVIGMPGDTIEGRIEDGNTVIYRNGKKLDEPYVNHLPLIGLHRTSGFFPWQSVGPLPIPGFLQYKESDGFYTYDPTASFENQPYYTMTANGILCYADGQPAMRLPFTPCIDDGINHDIFGPFVVPPGKYWLMGDNRKNSRDSRWWQFLDAEYIRSRASFVMWSIDSDEAFWFFDLIKHPIDFFTKHVRWNRFFKSLHTYQFPEAEMNVSGENRMLLDTTITPSFEQQPSKRVAS